MTVTSASAEIIEEKPSPHHTKLRPGAVAPFVEHRERQRHDHSSLRTTVEHTLADHKRWKQLQRWTHRRDRLPDTYQAIATLVSDRTITA